MRALDESQSLAVKRPKLALEWHPFKNGALTPSQVSYGTHKKAWWQCLKEKSHEWEADISNRSKGGGCPFCSNKAVHITNCLATCHPELAREWHPTKNGKLYPTDVLAGTGRKIWWLCSKDKDHAWEASGNDRKSGNGCPYCAGQKISKTNSLAARFPDLAKEWHPKRNGTLSPAQVPPGTHKEVWWLCKHDNAHEWQASIANRSKGRGCPYCAGWSLHPSKSLASLNPALADEWHPTRNGRIKPTDVSERSDKRVWWRCRANPSHQWQATTLARTSGRGSCPICPKPIKEPPPGKSIGDAFPKISAQWDKEKNLPLTTFDVEPNSKVRAWWRCRKNREHEWAEWIRDRVRNSSKYDCPICERKILHLSNSLASTHPNLAKEWHPKKNGNLSPKDILSGSNKLIWWRCTKDQRHEWQMKPTSRVFNESGCPFCEGRRVGAGSTLLDKFPKLAKEWHRTKNGGLTPGKVLPRSLEKVWWQCSVGKDHEFDMQIRLRTTRGFGCPICSGSRVVSSTSLAAKLPWIAKEWHPTKNGTVKPTEIAPAAKASVWWKCQTCGNDWRAAIYSRKAGRGCPKCNVAVTEAEARLASELSAVLREKTILQARVQGLEIDVYLPRLAIGVEIDGFNWHKNKEAFERKKEEALSASGIRIIRLRDKGLGIENEFGIRFDSHAPLKIETIQATLNLIKKERQLKSFQCRSIENYSKAKEFSAEKKYRETQANRAIPPLERSLEYKFPEVAKTWDFERNAPLTPRMVAANSGKEFWWICPAHKKIDWRTSVYSRVKVPKCDKCKREEKKKNSLATRYPALLREWDFEKNPEISPKEVAGASPLSVWWKCSKNKKHPGWKNIISNRSIHGQGCPYCANRLVCEVNSLATLNPNLAKEWHPKLNGPLTPDAVVPGSHKRVWWKCKNDRTHEWEERIFERNSGYGCPFCSGRRRK